MQTAASSTTCPDTTNAPSVLPIIFYLDGTVATRRASGQTTTPMVMTLGNFRIKLANRHLAKRTIGYMPRIKCTADAAGTDAAAFCTMLLPF